jgi:Tol biopolymer transport system component
MWSRQFIAAGVAAVAVSGLCGPAAAKPGEFPGETQLVFGEVADATISADGRFVAVTDLICLDTSVGADVWVVDRVKGVFRRVSGGAGGYYTGDSFDPAITAHGRYVAFTSKAPDLVPGDSNAASDVFVHDWVTGGTRRVSKASNGQQQANASSSQPAISAGGRYVAFTSNASNLVPGDTNAVWDVFVHDRATGATGRISTASNNEQGNAGSSQPAISANGRYVAFTSKASNLVPGDTNALWDVFVHDRATGVTQRVSTNSNGQQGNAGSAEPAISADGRYVAFTSNASNLVPGDTNGVSDVFVHDRRTGVTRRVSEASELEQGNGASSAPAISAHGRYVAFTSNASNLVPGDSNEDSDVFLHDRRRGVTQRASIGAGRQGNDDSYLPAITADGRSVAFTSRASNLVPGDEDGVPDLFVRGPRVGHSRIRPATPSATGPRAHPNCDI